MPYVGSVYSLYPADIKCMSGLSHFYYFMLLQLIGLPQLAYFHTTTHLVSFKYILLLKFSNGPNLPIPIHFILETTLAAYVHISNCKNSAG